MDPNLCLNLIALTPQVLSEVALTAAGYAAFRRRRMNYDSEVFINQFPIVKRFVYHLVYYRTLWAAYRKHELQYEFWTHTIDAPLLQAAIYWCMVFGSHGCNPTHWKHLSKAQSDELQQSFRDGLPQHTEIDWHQWEQHWKKMTAFRSKYASHRELNLVKPVPNFDIALKVAYYYDHWIRELISLDTFDEPLLEETADRLREAVAPLVNDLLDHTKGSQRNAEPDATPARH